MSVVKLDRIEQKDSQVILHINELDLLDGTPVVDIKPYVPYADIVPTATAGYAQEKPTTAMAVVFNTIAIQHLAVFSSDYKDLKQLIIQVLEQDPRPAYKHDKLDTRVYGMVLYNLNIQCKLMNKAQLK